MPDPAAQSAPAGQSSPKGPANPVAILARLAALPTAPFHELRVAREIVAICEAAGLPWEADPFGNLVAWHRGAKPTPSGVARFARSTPAGAPGGSGSRPLAFGAHMDHPALEVVQTAPLTGCLLGGVPRPYFERPVPVRLIHADEGPGETAGRITGYVEQDGMTLLNLEAAGPVPEGSFGVFDVGPFRDVDGLLYQPAADDLAGCAAILSALIRCRTQGVRADVAGVFTRCEEVGLIGATLVARQGLLPPETVVVSLETSRALPGAEIGGGPVIRVGDATMAFHPQGEALLRRARALLLERDPETRIQRQLMSGGTCEAVAYSLAGYVTTGVAFPLGNYHNAGPEGTISPEYIHRDDLQTGTDLLFASAECVAMGDAPDPAEMRLNLRADQAAERLRRSAARWRLR